MRHDRFVERVACPAELLLHDDAEALAVAHYLPAGRAVAPLGRQGPQLGFGHAGKATETRRRSLREQVVLPHGCCRPAIAWAHDAKDRGLLELRA